MAAIKPRGSVAGGARSDIARMARSYGRERPWIEHRAHGALLHYSAGTGGGPSGR